MEARRSWRDERLDKAGDIKILLTYNRFYGLIISLVISFALLSGCGDRGKEGAGGSASAIPTGVTALAGDGQATITWNAVSGATSYNIYFSTSAGVTKSSGTKISNAASPYTHTGLINGTTYYYVVTAVNIHGESVESSQASATPQAAGTAPSAPSSVTALAGDGQATITWNAVSGATSYNIYFSTSAGVTKSSGTKISNAASPYTHTGLINGTTYYYVVTAVNIHGESVESSQASATPQAAGTAPSAPTGVTASAGDGQVTITWNAVPRATSYNIYWSMTSGVTKTNGTKISKVASPYTHAGRTNGTTYYYVVTAVNRYGESVESNEVSATPQAATGHYHTVALKTDGTVWSWGYNRAGQLGDGTIKDRYTPVQVRGLTEVFAIATGHYHTVALKTDGTVWSWGYNKAGQLGDGTTGRNSTIPVQVSGLTGVSSITCGGFHTIALKTDGTVWAWGSNEAGQLGDGTTQDRYTPVQVSGLTGVSAIVAGHHHTVALKTDGTLLAWGSNGAGQLGAGITGRNSAHPVRVSGLTGVLAIAAGHYHTVALKTDGTVWAWGSNGAGQLGDGTTGRNSTIPVRVSGLTGVSAIAAGYDYTVALKTDGTVWACGNNGYGQLGNGTIGGNSPTPVQVGGLAGVSAIAGGGFHTVALKSDGTVWTWGYNRHGQLGDGTTVDRYTPVQVNGL